VTSCLNWVATAGQQHFPPVAMINDLRPSNLTYIDRVKINQRVRYLGQRSFNSKVIVPTHTHTGLILLPGPLKRSIIKFGFLKGVKKVGKTCELAPAVAPL